MTTKKTVKIKENPDFIKDFDTGAVINTNNSAYEARLVQMEKRKLSK